MNNILFATLSFYCLYRFLQFNLVKHIIFQQGGIRPKTFFKDSAGNITFVEPLSLLLHAGRIFEGVFLFMLGYKTEWWQPFMYYVLGWVFMLILYRIIHIVTIKLQRPNLVWLTMVSIIGIPICIFFMFYNLQGKEMVLSSRFFLIAAITLIILAIILLIWGNSVIGKPSGARPNIPNSSLTKLSFICLCLFIAGLYCFWQINHLVTLLLIGILLLYKLWGLYKSSEKIRALKICKYYKKRKLLDPSYSQDVILKGTVSDYSRYYSGWSDERIKSFDSILTKRLASDKDLTIKELINLIFDFEDTYFPKNKAKRDKAIEQAYNQLLGEKTVLKKSGVSIVKIVWQHDKWNILLGTILFWNAGQRMNPPGDNINLDSPAGLINLVAALIEIFLFFLVFRWVQKKFGLYFGRYTWYAIAGVAVVTLMLLCHFIPAILELHELGLCLMLIGLFVLGIVITKKVWFKVAKQVEHNPKKEATKTVNWIFYKGGPQEPNNEKIKKSLSLFQKLSQNIFKFPSQKKLKYYILSSVFVIVAIIIFLVKFPSHTSANNPSQVAITPHDSIFTKDATEIYKNTVKSTVTIETDLARGSGFFVGDGIIATNYHVMKGAKYAHCYTNDSITRYKIEGYIGVYKSADLILLKVSGLNRPPIKLSDAKLEIGQKIYVIGSPKGLAATISDGIVSALRNFVGNRYIQITAPISPGSSGGPVLNSRGELIGVSKASIEEGQNLNFAIPIEYLKSLLNTVENKVFPITKLNTPEGEELEFVKNLKSVKIGTQNWTVENLDVTTFCNGDPIPEAQSLEEWIEAGKLGKPMRCSFSVDLGDNKVLNEKDGNDFGLNLNDHYSVIHGFYKQILLSKNFPQACISMSGILYNWYAIKDSRGLAPQGWHIPASDEWTTLINYLGGVDVAGKKMQSISGFFALPAAYRDQAGSYSLDLASIKFWSKTDCGNNQAFSVSLTLGSSNAVSSGYEKNYGFSVRCVKD